MFDFVNAHFHRYTIYLYNNGLLLDIEYAELEWLLQLTDRHGQQKGSAL